MMQLINNPRPEQLSGDRAIWQFKLSDENGQPFRAYGALSRIYTNGTLAFTDGDRLFLKWTDDLGVSVAAGFIARTNPDPENFQEFQAGYVGTVLETFEVIAAKMQQRLQIGSLFNIYADQVPDGNFTLTRLNFEAKDTSANWTVELIGLVASANWSYETLPATEDNTPAGYAATVEVLYEDNYQGNDYNKVATLRAAPTSAGQVTFNLKSILRSYTERRLGFTPIPDLPITAPWLSEHQRQYYLRYNDATQSWKVSGIFKVIAGRRDQIFTRDIFASTDWLTFAVSRRAGYDQDGFLHWYNNSAINQGTVLEVLTWDNEGTSGSDYSTSLTIPGKSIGSFPIGASQLGLSADIRRYTLRLVDAGSDYAGGSPVYLSNTVEVVVDQNYYRQIHDFYYLNNFYLPETLRCTQEQTIETQVQRTLSRSILDVEFEKSDRENYQADWDVQELYTFQSGFLPRSQALGLREVLAQNKIWKVENGNLVRWLILTDQFELVQQDQYLYSVQFQAIRSIESEAVTDLDNIDITGPSSAPEVVVDPDGQVPVAPDGQVITPT